ncbi:MAG: Nif3-like dinuclear metal center hexameric protein [Deltaproteobacteria bacterium]|nr:Nif3-like dinuclear metal center hexameric protein [Deltaproteobacteria bacterium]
MAVEIRHFLDLLETIAPAALAETWDNPGLQVGNPTATVNHVLVALDPTLSAVRAAAKADAQVLFTHHPLIFRPISRVDATSFPGNVIFEAFKGRLSILSAHTNLDSAQGGINDMLAELLGLENVSVLSPVDASAQAGLGRVGDLPAPASLGRFAREVGRHLGIDNLKRVGDKNRRIHRVAVVGGSGGSLVMCAHEVGADLLLTGDVGHHAALEAASLGLALLDGGHFRTEKAAFTLFAEKLAERCAAEGWSIEFSVYEDEADPMTWEMGDG